MERKTIKEVYLAWREMKVSLVKESTFATYVTNAEKHILPVLGDMHSVKESNVQQFVLDKLKAGLSQRTVRDILLVLKMIVAYGTRQRWLEHCEWDIKFPTTAERHEFQVLTINEQRKLMTFLKSHFSFKNLGLVYLSLHRTAHRRNLRA